MEDISCPISFSQNSNHGETSIHFIYWQVIEGLHHSGIKSKRPGATCRDYCPFFVRHSCFCSIQGFPSVDIISVKQQHGRQFTLSHGITDLIKWCLLKRNLVGEFYSKRYNLLELKYAPEKVLLWYIPVVQDCPNPGLLDNGRFIFPYCEASFSVVQDWDSPVHPEYLTLSSIKSTHSEVSSTIFLHRAYLV